MVSFFTSKGITGMISLQIHSPLDDCDEVEKMRDLESGDLGSSPDSALKEGKRIDFYWNLLCASALLGTSSVISPFSLPG